MQLDKSVPTNDSVRVIGTVSYGGTLTVTNLAGTLAGLRCADPTLHDFGRISRTG